MFITFPLQKMLPIAYYTKKNIAIALLIIGCVSFLFYQSSSYKKEHYAAPYLQAKKIFYVLAHSHSNEEQSLEQLKILLKSYPDLQPWYDGNIVQRGIIEHRLEQEIASRALQRLQVHNLPEYNAYAQHSILIEQQEYKEALEKAKQLQLTMQQDVVLQKSALYGLNLLRIAALEKQQTSTTQTQAWQQLLQHMEQDAYAPWAQAVSQREMDLKQYVKKEIGAEHQ